ncbi:MAG: RNA polymerase sigma factor [Candidatus Zhuqueibacterota bacterium]
MEKSEKLLILKAQRGSQSAFESLVANYDARVLGLIYSMLNNWEDARDVYQDVFLKVFKSIGNFRFQSEFYTWLYRIVVNECINYRRKRSQKMHDSIDDVVEQMESDLKFVHDEVISNPERNMLEKELQREISQGIEHLSPKQKAVFTLRHYHGYKLSEIAEIMNCSEGTIKNYLFRALQKMKEQLRDYYQN